MTTQRQIYAEPRWQRELSSLMDAAPIELAAWAVTAVVTVGVNGFLVW